MLVTRVNSNYQKSQLDYTKKDIYNKKNDQLTFTGGLKSVKKPSKSTLAILGMVVGILAAILGFDKSDEADMKNPKKARRMLTELKSEYAKNDSALKAKGVTYIMSEKIKPTLRDSVEMFRKHVLNQTKILKNQF